MSKLKGLTKLEFELLYNLMPLKTLAKELDVDVVPLWKRAKKYKLTPKPMGRPVEKVLFKGEQVEKYSPEIKEILIRTLILDGVEDARLIKKGYSEEYIKDMHKKYDYYVY